MRNFACDRPRSVSQVHCTSFAVNGCPSCHRTPSRSRNVSSVPSSLHDHSVARSGRIDCIVFCGTCWSNRTRLLKTAIIGAMVEIVTSSSVDMLAGLSRWATWSTPPGFWASALPAPVMVISSALAATAAQSLSVTSLASFCSPLMTELDPENETVGEGGALPLEGADGAGAGHEADTQESQCRVQGQGGAGSNQGRPDGGRAGERIWGSSEPDLQVEEAAAGRRGERVRGWRLGVGGSGQRGTG